METMAEDPLVSVVTPVLNGMKYLEVSIQSVLNQTYTNIEQIFVDGGSADGTLDMIDGYRGEHPDRIRLISEPDAGIAEATNKGMKMVRGGIVGWLSSDDVYEKDAIMTVVEFFKSRPEVYFIFGSCNYINQRGEVIGKVPVGDFDLREALNNKHRINLTSAFYRREVIERIGVLNALGSELDFYVRVAKVFPLHRIDEVLSNSRVHEDATTAGKRGDKKNLLRQTWREDYLLRRREGVSFLAPASRRYFAFVVLDRLGLYYYVNTRILLRLRSYRIVDRAIRLLGL